MPPVRSAEPHRAFDHLLGIVLMLVVLGAIAVYSASSSEQIIQGGGGDGAGFLVRYAIFGVLGFGLLWVATRFGVRSLRTLTLPLLVVAVVLCLAVLAPGIGREVNGAKRWIGNGAIGFQPSELAKFAVVAFLALALSRRRTPMRTLRDVRWELFVVGLFVAVVGGLQSDLGTAMVIGVAAACVLVVGGMPLRFFAPIGAVAGAGVLLMVLAAPYRVARLTSFLSPWSDAAGNGYQAIQGQLAIGSGGFFGNGLGSSVQKAEWLPEAHTDFILAVIGEELGAIGVLGLLALYAMLAHTGLRIADRAPDPYQRLLATGIVGIITCQAILNIWVVLGIFPLTGVPLPFISYGSTNLVMLLGGIGLLLNIARGTAPASAPAPLVDGDGPPRGRAPRPRREPSRPRRAPVGRPVLRPVPDPVPTLASARAADRRVGAQGSAGDSTELRDRRGWDGRARGARAGGRRRAAG
ncbi:MAG: putative lipid II flippase FtsW [Solirubrobacteraceae bacterium]|nr:putative lipid II flippase FtsW [Solirubrobacteraceae bacterium]